MDQVLALLADQTSVPWTNLGKSFEARKCFQKTIFLLQNEPYSLNLGYSFNLYLYGPYSGRLATVGYEIAENIEAHKTFVGGHSFNKDIMDKIEAFNAFVEEGMAKSKLRREEFLELAGTILFIYRYTLPQGEKNKAEEAGKRTALLKPWCRPTTRDLIVNTMRKCRLIT